MNRSGDAELRVRTRAALLDALDALEDQLDALIVIGAQAVFLHTGELDVPIPIETKDADLGVDAHSLHDDPRLEQALEAAEFHRNLVRPQPGAWIAPNGIPVDLMIPEAMAGPNASNRRGARVPPHDRGAMRRTEGLEATIVDNALMTLSALDPSDERARTVRVAGPGALLVAKLFKLGERHEKGGSRLRDKDAHDLYRLMVAAETSDLAMTFLELRANPFTASVTERALVYLKDLFAAGPDAAGSRMAGRAEAGVGAPETVAASVTALAADLLSAIDGEGHEDLA